MTTRGPLVAQTPYMGRSTDARRGAARLGDETPVLVPDSVGRFAGIRSVLADLRLAREVVRFVFPYLWPYRRRLVGVLCIGILASLSQAAMPLLTKYVFDDIILAKDMPLFLRCALCVGVAALGVHILGIISGYIGIYVSSLAQWHLRRAYLLCCTRLSSERFDGKRLGEYLTGMNSDVPAIVQMVTTVLLNAFTCTVALGASAIIMMRLEWRISVLYACAIPLLLAYRIVSSSILKRYQEAAREVEARNATALYEAIQLVPTARLFGRECHTIHIYQKTAKQSLLMAFRLWRVTTLLSQGQLLLESGPMALMTFVTWLLVVEGRITAGSAMALSMYFGVFITPFMGVVGIIQQLIAGVVPGKRVITLFEHANRTYPKRALKLSGAPAIGLHNVTFGYRPGQAVFRDLSIEIAPGRCTVLMGPSGCGKTTILDLLAVLHAPESGSICVDGQSLAEYDPRSVRRQIGYARQEAVVLSGTIRDNIRYGKLDASDSEIMDAAHDACIAEFIESLPRQLDTLICAEHVSLSSGQKQRICLARVFLMRPRILLLDEPFANLDMTVERRIWGNLLRSNRSRSIVIVTHSSPPCEFLNDILLVRLG